MESSNYARSSCMVWGGVGKTEIATEFVFKHKEKFDAIFFLHADNRARLSRELVRVADILGLHGGSDVDKAKDVVKDWLADPVKPPNESKPPSSSFGGQAGPTLGDTGLPKWLIVFDNADDPEILLDYWPDNGIGSMLVTSRDLMARDDLYFGNDGHEVRELSVDVAAAFLRSMTGNQETVESEKASKQIAARLSGHPLAIEQIGPIIQRNAFSLTEFLNIYKEEEDLEVLQDMRIARGRGYKHSITGVWALQDLPKESLALLNVMTFLDPDCIQGHIFIENLDTIDLAFFPTSSTGFHAATCLLKAIQDRISALGENDCQSVRTGQLYYALGNVRASQAATNPAMFAISAELHQKALFDYRRTAGNDHYRTACACYRVAEHCIRNKQCDVAQ